MFKSHLFAWLRLEATILPALRYDKPSLIRHCSVRRRSSHFDVNNHVMKVTFELSDSGTPYPFPSNILNLHIFTVRHEVAKVMFLHLSVSHSVHGNGSSWAGTPGPVHPPWDQVHPLGQVHPPADGYCCGRYASYWNQFLLYLKWKTKCAPYSLFTFKIFYYILFLIVDGLKLKSNNLHLEKFLYQEKSEGNDKNTVKCCNTIEIITEV